MPRWLDRVLPNLDLEGQALTERLAANQSRGDEPEEARTTRIEQHVNAPRARVYRALVDPQAVAAWQVPDGMTAIVHEFEVREGGAIRISLAYADQDERGKSHDNVDTFGGHFVRVVPDERVEQALEFETDDPGLQGTMRVSYTLRDAGDGGTDVVGVHEGLPEGLSPEQNQEGWQMSLRKLAELVEQDASGSIDQ
jgi:uncharacterized protein YndB with AHSA1/START domain